MSDIRLVKLKSGEEIIGDVTVIDNFQSMQKEVLSVNIGDTRVAKQKTFTARSGYKVFVLVEYDRGAANKRLLQKLEEDKALYDAFRTTQLYKEMESEVESYRSRNSK